MAQPNQSIRYCWEADKVKTLIRLRAELSPLFTGKRNASKYAWAVVERELNVPLPISKIIKKWNNLLQEYKAIKLSEEPKRREWPFFNLMDVYFSDQVNDPSLRLFSSTKRFDTDTFDDKNFDEELQAVLAAANLNSSMSSVLQNLGLGLGMNRQSFLKRDSNIASNNNINNSSNNPMDIDIIDDKHDDEDEDNKSEVSINLSTKLLTSTLMNTNNSTNDKNNNKSHLTSLNSTSKHNENIGIEKDVCLIEPNNNNTMNSNRNLMGRDANSYSTNSEGSINSSRNSASSHANINDEDYEDNMVRAYERNLKNLNQKFLHEMSEHHNIDQYLLSWRGFHGNMCKGFHNLQRDGQMVDVTIAAGGKIFKAHKLVLSVCSPYFQKIFIEHPSSHPILFMTDVNSNHMAGLLDFMYSGQVNVKYEDLPNFLKVAEALQVKGLHGESTTDNNEEREREREREESNYASQYRQQQQQQALHLQQQQFNYSQMQRQPVSQSPHFQHPDNIINENRQNIRHHIKPKTTFINSNNNSINSNNNNNPDTTTMNINNNNNNSINNNNNSINLTNNNHHKFGVQQVNSSSKMLDNQKYQKYFAKRKLLAQYEQEMRQEKRNRTGGSIDDDDNDSNRPLNMRRSQSVTEDDSRNTDIGSAKSISVGLNLIQNIKTEKGDDDHADINGNDDGNETGTGFYGSHLSKMKHSILEPNIVLQHSDEVISASNGNNNSITSTLQNTNLSQKTAS
ncbi:uncharacterized protein DDB_G0283357-like [Chironomus tepperi]|uniref:uncharacterized protein DDB_G0283357-like n=1 Tax=Chironomus tepperi TaxID=113505 RepID=UPI00391F95C1